ncbi:MAG TPA: type II toxin-antitoxin system VapC family toxin [Verrucomicrobiae bacterium]|nr:type II toxin-antitoxin system VapC family toxin [Verrucomicrobiae bacterium]
MNILLDTHLLLWWLNDSDNLSARAREIIANPANTIFISAATLWEIRLKQSLGKLSLPSGFEAALSGGSFESLPVTAAHTCGIAGLPWHHRDPFDRMLVAQAASEGFTLLTADRALTPYGECVDFAG